MVYIRRLILQHPRTMDDKLYESTQDTHMVCQVNKLELSDVKSNLFLNIQASLKKHRIIAVSLSGGVDSMVLLVILCQLRKMKQIDAIYAIHINYGNRKESFVEATFCKNSVSTSRYRLLFKPCII
jgi:predicted phosphoadenosine phosphosulfate sulfurtransferase